QVARPGPGPLRHGGDPSREPDGRLRPSHDLDLLPGEGARDAEPERLPHRLLAREAARVALGRVRSRVAVRLLGGREAAVAEARVPVERAADAGDLDQVRSDAD